MNIDDAVKRFQKEWNSDEYARLQKEYDELRDTMYIYGIVNFNDVAFFDNSEVGSVAKVAQKAHSRLEGLKLDLESYNIEPEPIKFKLEKKKKYGDLYFGRPPHSWEGTDEDIVWHKWAIVDLGQTDPDRRGGLIKYGGYGRPEPKKYLRGHLYPETIIKEGWIPKKHKDRVGKPYGDPLQGAKDSNGRLSSYGVEYYI